MAVFRNGPLVLALLGALTVALPAPGFGYAPEEHGRMEARPGAVGSLGANLAFPAIGPDGSGETFRGCAEAAYGVFGYILEIGMGRPPEEVQGIAPSLGSAAALRAMIEDDGLETAYLTSHALYLRCASEADERMRTARRTPSREEKAYADCGLRSANRLLVLTAAQQRQPKADLLPLLSRDARERAAALYDIAERDSLLKALVVSGEAHRACVDAIREP